MAESQAEGTPAEGAPTPDPAPAGRTRRRPVIKRRVKRKEVQEELQQPDEFQERGRTVVDWVLERWKIFAGGIAVILLGLLVYGIVSRAQDGTREAAAEALYAALRELPDTSGLLPTDGSEAGLDEGLAALDKVIAEYDGTPQAAQARVEAGNAAYQAGRFDVAQTYFDGATSAAGYAGYAAKSGKAYALESQGKLDEAAALFQELRKADGQSRREQATLDLARVWAEAGKTTEAKGLLDGFEVEFPDSGRLEEARSQAASLAAAK